MSSEPITAALIVAAGRGHRAGEGLPKQYRALPQGNGETVLGATLGAFVSHKEVQRLCVVIHPDDVELYNDSLKTLSCIDNIEYVFGGETRQESVLEGLKALAKHGPEAKQTPKQVLIHDGARPFVSAEIISRCLTALGSAAGAIPALEVTDTLKRAEQGTVTQTVSREGLWRAQTPQAFRFDAILAAHASAPILPNITDDAAIAELAGLPLAIVAGEVGNVKLTHAEDFVSQSPNVLPRTGSTLLPRTGSTLLPRTGSGFDVHRLGEPDSAEAIMLGGVSIPHNRELIGHSDADVALHAITDALLGALVQGDIGDHFPPSDAAHKNRPSRDFLAHAVHLAEQAMAQITHIDLTLICEQPKIGPHRQAMREKIAQITGLDVACVSVKATTTEGLGYTGRGEGIAAQSMVTLVVPTPIGQERAQ
jgi:2-C-methyl-D-erythritol 4-phosphate cytidylyltransferase/2-C-methyl-D-erythritol 2,4-cyclodiphosphate synthase